MRLGFLLVPLDSWVLTPGWGDSLAISMLDCQLGPLSNLAITRSVHHEYTDWAEHWDDEVEN